MFNRKPCGTAFKTCTTCLVRRARNAAAKAVSSAAWRANKLKEDPTYAARHSAAWRDRQRHLDPEAFLEQQRAWRARRMREDPGAYRRHSTQTTRAWRENNRAHFLAYQRAYDNSIARRLKHFKRHAADRGYAWALTDAACETLLAGPCFYCGTVEAGVVNGVDRMDNTVGYTPENCRTCCRTCNTMKLCLDARTFVDRCVHLDASSRQSGERQSSSDAATLWPDTTRPSTFAVYVRSARKYNREFTLTESMYAAITETPCTYCRRAVTATNRSGIDRIDNDAGYTPDNVVACCTECNRMRGSLRVDVFLETCRAIAARASVLRIPEMPACRNAITPRPGSRIGRPPKNTGAPKK
jgi:hypothetical protein